MIRKVLTPLFIFSSITLFLSHCGSNDVEDPVDCNTTDLAVTVTGTQPVSGCQTTDGRVDVNATGGKSPYQFSINGGAFQSATQFTSLASGTYTITVKDANACEKTVEAVVASSGSTLAATATVGADTQCLTNNGTISISAQGGTAPYQFQLDGGSFGSNASFAGVAAGNHTVVVKDAANCQVSVSAVVARGNTGISFDDAIKPIIEARCATGGGCHGAGSGSRDWTNATNLKNNSANVKSRTGAKTMPPAGSTALTQDQIDQIACWVDDGAPIDN